MEGLWDLMRSIPSLECENASVLGRVSTGSKKGRHPPPLAAADDPEFARGCPYKWTASICCRGRRKNEINLAGITRDEDMYDKKLNRVFGKDFFDSNFWVIGGRCSISMRGTAPSKEGGTLYASPTTSTDSRIDRCHVQRLNQYESFVLGGRPG